MADHFSSAGAIFGSIERQGGISRQDASILVKSGTLDSISGDLNHPQMLWFIEAAVGPPARFAAASGGAVGPPARIAAASGGGKNKAVGPPARFAAASGGGKNYRQQLLHEPQSPLLFPQKPRAIFSPPLPFKETSEAVPQTPPFPKGGPGGIFLPPSKAAANPDGGPTAPFLPPPEAAEIQAGGPTAPALPDFSSERKWAHELETLGFLLSIHPLELAEPFFRPLRKSLVPASEMAAHVGKKIQMKGWPITRKEVLTREGEEMEFFTFEDETGLLKRSFSRNHSDDFARTST